MHDHYSHDHPHGHAHAPASFGFAFALGTALNIGFVIVEAAFGVLSGSTALLADAGHNLSDVLGLLIAWGAATLSKRAPDGRYTYGLRGSSILAALGNGLLLMVACGAIAWEAVQRIAEPAPVAGATVSIVAAIGVVINGFSAWLFLAGSKGDLNIRGAYLHMAADAALSLGVVISGLAIMASGWTWIDPIVSLVIVVVIVIGTWSLLRESVQLSMAAVPPNVDAGKVQAFLAGQPGVTEVHDLHIWAMSTTETALTVHLIRPDATIDDAWLDAIVHELHDRFSIEHATIQLESGRGPHACPLASHDVV